MGDLINSARGIWCTGKIYNADKHRTQLAQHSWETVAGKHMQDGMTSTIYKSGSLEEKKKTKTGRQCCMAWRQISAACVHRTVTCLATDPEQKQKMLSLIVMNTPTSCLHLSTLHFCNNVDHNCRCNQRKCWLSFAVNTSKQTSLHATYPQSCTNEHIWHS